MSVLMRGGGRGNCDYQPRESLKRGLGGGVGRKRAVRVKEEFGAIVVISRPF